MICVAHLILLTGICAEAAPPRYTGLLRLARRRAHGDVLTVDEPWSASGLAERAASAGSISGAFFQALVAPVLRYVEGPIERGTAPVEFWGDDRAPSRVEDTRPLKSAELVASRVQLSLLPAEWDMMNHLVEKSSSLFLFGSELASWAASVKSLRHVHVVEADPALARRTRGRPEVQRAIDEGRLVLTGSSSIAGPPCSAADVRGAFEADWQLLVLTRKCESAGLLAALQAAAPGARAALLGPAGPGVSGDLVPGKAGVFNVFNRSSSLYVIAAPAVDVPQHGKP